MLKIKRHHLYIGLFMCWPLQVLSAEKLNCITALQQLLTPRFYKEAQAFKATPEYKKNVEKIKDAQVDALYLEANTPKAMAEIIEEKHNLRVSINRLRRWSGHQASEDLRNVTALSQLDHMLTLKLNDPVTEVAAAATRVARLEAETLTTLSSKSDTKIEDHFFVLFSNVTRSYYGFTRNERFIKEAQEVIESGYFKENSDYFGLTENELKKIILMKRKENFKKIEELAKIYGLYESVFNELKKYSTSQDQALNEVKAMVQTHFDHFFLTDKFTRQVVTPNSNGTYPPSAPTLDQIEVILKNPDYGEIGEILKLKQDKRAAGIALLWKYSPTRAIANTLEEKVLAKIPYVRASFIRNYFRVFKNTQSQVLYYQHIYKLDHIKSSLARLENVDVYNAALAERQFDYIMHVNADTENEFLITLARRPDMTQTRDYIKRFIAGKIKEAEENGVKNSSFIQHQDRFKWAEEEAVRLRDLPPFGSPLMVHFLSGTMDVTGIATATYLTYLAQQYYSYESDEGLVEVTPLDEVTEEEMKMIEETALELPAQP